MDAAETRVPEDRLHPVCMPLSTLLLTRTGTWRYVRPVVAPRQAPCSHACPTGVKIREYLDVLGKGRWEEAWRLVKEDNPLPAVTGRVCYHPCEEACNRSCYDQALSIHCLEREVGDYGLAAGLVLEKPKTTQNEKVAVVGSGPAGLAAAYHLRRKGYPVTVFEAESSVGGMLRRGIPSYRLPREVLDKELAGIEALGVEMRCNMGLGANLSWRDLSPFGAVFVATGCYRSLPLGIPGEDTAGVCSGLDFLRDVHTGRLGTGSLAGQTVVVVGGGNVAMDAARCARRVGAKEVLVLYRRSEQEIGAHPQELADAREEGVDLRYLVSPVAIGGSKGRLQVQAVRNRLTEPDASGRPLPIPIEGSGFLLDADRLIVAVGQTADLAFVPQDAAVADRGRLPESLGMLEGTLVLAGGDAVTGPARVVDALAAGKRAAGAIEAALKAIPAAPEAEAAVVGYEELNTDYFFPAPRREGDRLSPGARVGGFEEVAGGLNRQETLEEAQRCFHCGACNQCGNCWLFCPDMSVGQGDGKPEIDYEFCKGCGICAQECPRAVIQTEEERE